MNKIVQLLNKNIKLRQSTADIVFGGIVIALNLFLLTVGVNKYISEGYGNSFGITSRTFPRFIFGGAILLGAVLALEALRRRKKRDPNEKIVEFHLIHLAILATIILFVFTIKPLGYPIANLIMMILMYWLSGGKSWVKCLILAVVFTVCSVLFFYTYLKLSIPMGLLSWLIR